MELQEFIAPERVTQGVEEIITLTSPSKLKIQTTGPSAQNLLDQGPPIGKTWRIRVRIDALETNG